MIEFQKTWYTPEQCRSQPEKYFVFGDNTHRVGNGGQAKIRYELNALGVVTKWSPTMASDAFFNERNHSYLDLISIVASDLAVIDRKLKEGATIVWPWDNVGTGLSKLPHYGPRTYQFICDTVAEWINLVELVGIYTDVPDWVKR